MPSERLLGKLCCPIVVGPTLDRARRFAADELSISFDLVESDNDQTIRGKVWIEFRLLVWQVSHASQEM